MAITVYNQPAPVLEVSLQSGGSLSPNTTYYITGFYYSIFGNISQLAQQVSITTTTTELSIQIQAKWWDGSQWKYDAPPLGVGYNYITIGNMNLGLEYYFRYVVDTVDMTEGGNYFWRGGNICSSYRRIYLNTPFSILLTSFSKIAQDGLFIPSFYCYYYPSLRMPDIFKVQKEIPFIDCSGTETINNLITYLVANRPDIVLDSNNAGGACGLGIMATLYFSYQNHSLNSVAFRMYESSLFIKGTLYFSTVFISAFAYSKGFAAGTSNENFFSTYNYRPVIIAGQGTNNYVTSFGNQYVLSANNSVPFTYIRCYLLTNGMNENNYIKLLNSLLINQTVSPSGEITRDFYHFHDVSKTAYLYELSACNSFNQNPAVFTFNGYDLVLLNRTPREGIDYVAEKKPRIYWFGANSQGRNDITYVFRYKVSIKVVDKNGTPLVVNVQAVNNFETINTQTNEAGEVILYVKSRVANADNSKGIPTYYTLWQESLTTLNITKEGYKSYNYENLFIETTSLVVVLEILPLEIATLNFTHPSKANNDGTITVQATGGLAPYQFSIDGGETWQVTGEFTGLPQGTYQIVVKDAEDTEVAGLEVELKAPQYYSDELSGTITDDEITGSVEVIELTGTIS